VHLGVEGSCLGGRAQRRDRFCVSSLPRKRDSQIEQRVRNFRARIEHHSKRAFGLDEVLTLQRFPSLSERDVDVSRQRVTPQARVADSRPPESHDAEKN
jgi:hypothetical protein